MSNPSFSPNRSLHTLENRKNRVSHDILRSKSGFQTGLRVLRKRHFRAFMPQGVLNRPHVNLLAFVQVIGDSLAKVVKSETSDHPPGGIHVAAILLPKNDPRPLCRRVDVI